MSREAETHEIFSLIRRITLCGCRRSLPIDSTQGVRKRTRAGMGHCQGVEKNYNCECRVADIVARENGYNDVTGIGRRPWPATSTLPQRWLTDDEKENMHRLQGVAV